MPSARSVPFEVNIDSERMGVTRREDRDKARPKEDLEACVGLCVGIEIQMNALPDNPVLTPAENDRVRAMGGNPADYAALATDAHVDTRQGLALGPVQTPHGPVDCLVIPLMVLLPTNHLAAMSGLVGPDGHPPNPVEGMIPVIPVRVLIPLAKLAMRPRLVVPDFANGDFPDRIA